jgi:CRP-like cAMP-binding protein
LDHYERSLYWTFQTLTTTGYGDITPQSIAQTVVAEVLLTIGVTLFAVIIANVTGLVHSVEVSEDNIGHQRNVVKTFLTRKRIPEDIRQYALGHYAYMIADKDGVDEAQFLRRAVPPFLSHEISEFLTHDLVLGLDLFSQTEPGILREIMRSLTYRVYPKDSFILKRVPAADGLYLLQTGSVHILSLDGNFIQQLSAGSCFAEEAATRTWYSNPFAVQAATDCELWFLHRLSLVDIMYKYVASKELFRALRKHSAISTRKMSMASIIGNMRTIVRQPVVEPWGASWAPDSSQVRTWSILVLLATLYNLIMVPLRLAYFDELDVDAWFVVDYLLDVVLLLDIWLRAYQVAYFVNKELIRSRANIFDRYIHSHNACLHVLASIPLDMCLLAGCVGPLSPAQTLALLRVNKLVRVLEAPSLLVELDRVVVERKVRFGKKTIFILKLTAVILASAHVFGCGFFLLAFLAHRSGSAHNWADVAGILRACNLGSKCGYPPKSSLLVTQYTYSLYWATYTITTTGYGDVAAISKVETVYSIFVLILGSLIFTLVIVHLEDIIAQLDVTSTLAQSLRLQVCVYLAYVTRMLRTQSDYQRSTCACCHRS